MPEHRSVTSQPFRKSTDALVSGFIRIGILPTRNLTCPLDAFVEPDDGGFIARAVDLPLYGYGDDPLEAVQALKCEIESLYEDLMQDDEFTAEWLRIKESLLDRISPR